MKVKINVVNFGQVVTVEIKGVDEDDVRLLLGGGDAVGRYAKRDARRRGPAPPATAATPEMVARGIDAFLARGDRARLGEALAEVWRAMEQVRSGPLDDEDG